MHDGVRRSMKEQERSNAKVIDIQLMDFGEKLESLNIKVLELHDNSELYLKRYIDNLKFYLNLDFDLIELASRRISKNVSESTLIDFGGGIGLFSMLAKYSGFSKVIYVDIDQNSLEDAQKIASSIGYSADSYILLESDMFSKSELMLPDVVVSRDVIEHVYSLNDFLQSATALGWNEMIHNTSANPKNLWLKRYFKDVHLKAEFEGYKDDLGHKDSQSTKSYFQIRREYINSLIPDILEEELDSLSLSSRGYRLEDIREIIKSGQLAFPTKSQVSTNTCDPNTGNWAERLLFEFEYRAIAQKYGYEMTTRAGLMNEWKSNKFKAVLSWLINRLNRNNFTSAHLWPSVTMSWSRKPNKSGD